MKTDTIIDPAVLATWIEKNIYASGYQDDGYPKQWDIQFHRDEWGLIVRGLKQLARLKA
jgi:hypothetical protein